MPVILGSSSSRTSLKANHKFLRSLAFRHFVCRVSRGFGVKRHAVEHDQPRSIFVFVSGRDALKCSNTSGVALEYTGKTSGTCISMEGQMPVLTPTHYPGSLPQTGRSRSPRPRTVRRTPQSPSRPHDTLAETRRVLLGIVHPCRKAAASTHAPCSRFVPRRRQPRAGRTESALCKAPFVLPRRAAAGGASRWIIPER